MANTFLRRVTFQNSAFVPYVLCKFCPASAPRFSWNSSEKTPKEIAELLFQVDSAFQQIEPMRQLKAENFYNCICLLASVGYWFPNLPNIICNYKFPWCRLFKQNLFLWSEWFQWEDYSRSKERSSREGEELGDKTNENIQLVPIFDCILTLFTFIFLSLCLFSDFKSLLAWQRAEWDPKLLPTIKYSSSIFIPNEAGTIAHLWVWLGPGSP